MIALLVALGCGDASPEPTHSEEHGTTEHPQDHPHKVGSTAHRFDDPDRWTEVFDDPERDAWQRPTVVVAALDLQPGEAVADIGAGTGYFNPHLAEAVGSGGTVIPVDIEPSMVTHMTERATVDGTPQVRPRLGATDDPRLEEDEVDAILLVDTYHHLTDRETYFGALHHALRPGGRLVVVDFKQGEIPVGPPESHRIAPDDVIAELKAGGWAVASDDRESLPYQYVLAFTAH